MRLWPLDLIRKLRARPAAHRILPLDPRERDMLDRLRDRRSVETRGEHLPPKDPSRHADNRS